MGLTKAELFTERQKRIAQLTKTLGHPARIAILMYLMKKNACVCGDIVGKIPLAQSTISQHLKALKQAGIIQGEISGTKTCYCIDPTVWQEMRTVLNTFFSGYQGGC